jgi:hypothetical protein
MADLVFGNVPHPPFVDRYIPDSETDAWNDLGQRVPKGVCHHSMLGTLHSTDLYFRRNGPAPGFEPGGLTDYGVGNDLDGPALDGVIYRWNDPLGRRAGWASGGSDGLEGDGPAFVRTLGVNAINRDLVSIERSDGGDQLRPSSPKQFESICQLTAHWFDYAHVPYDAFPVNPNAGCVTDMEHFEFAIKACPFAWFRGHINEVQDRVRMILKAAQVVSSPAPPPTPAPPESEWSNGWTTAQLKTQFGKVTEITIDKKNVITGSRSLGFDPKGVLSNMWVHRAVAEGITDVKRIPKPSHFTVTRAKDDTGCSVFIVPRSGYKDWIGFRGDGNASWIWIQ